MTKTISWLHQFFPTRYSLVKEPLGAVAPAVSLSAVRDSALSAIQCQQLFFKPGIFFPAALAARRLRRRVGESAPSLRRRQQLFFNSESFLRHFHVPLDSLSGEVAICTNSPLSSTLFCHLLLFFYTRQSNSTDNSTKNLRQLKEFVRVM